MKIILDTKKSARENAQVFFEEAKTLKSKITGAQSGMREVHAKIAALEQKARADAPAALEIRRSKEWFEKYRWCVTRNGLLVVGGKDAHSNEAVVRKHLEENDWYFHADVHGAPHCVLKKGKTLAKKEDLEDAAAFAGLFSSVWKKGSLGVRVYRVSMEQVSKKAPAGESLGKGAFMIYGVREWYNPIMRLAWGVQPVQDGARILCGPLPAVRAHAQHVMEIVPGPKSKSDTAKAYRRTLEKTNPPIKVSLDELIAALPTGEFSLKPILSARN